MSVENKLVAIVTGAAQGIGLGIAESLLKEGYKVCLADINPLKGQKVRDVLSQKYGKDHVIFMTCDVSKESHVESMFVEVLRIFKRVDVLVNNAGVIGEDDVQRILMINLGGPIYGCKAALKHMGKNYGGNGGKVVNVASIAGLIPSIYVPIYCSTKHGVVGLTRSLGTPYIYEPSGITFTAMCPAWVMTDLQAEYQPLLPESLGAIKDRPDLMDPSYIGEGVLKLLKENRNGATLMATKFEGFQYIELSEQLKNVMENLH